HPAFIAASGTVAAYEGRRTENVDVGQGSFSINETFILSSGAYVHTYSYQLSTNNLGVSVVNLDGNIRGLGRDGKAYPRAYAGWLNIKNNLPAEASGAYSELGGHATLYTNNYESFSLTRNKLLGTLDYSVSYTDDSTQNLPSGIQDFSISVQENKAMRLFASFPIMERTLGNIVQDIGTTTEGTISITGTAVGEQGYPFDDLLVYTESRINELRPLSVNYVTLRLSDVNVTKDELRNTVNFTITYTYTKDLSNILNGDDDIILG
ncbi:MAG TPA: hypothetical protein VFV86_10855, partial [Nitrososphaeraceae archaeon]|nr:hypothetical protein [Nitrososphaeraceae archaeon]